MAALPNNFRPMFLHEAFGRAAGGLAHQATVAEEAMRAGWQRAPLQDPRPCQGTAWVFQALALGWVPPSPEGLEETTQATPMEPSLPRLPRAHSAPACLAVKPVSDMQVSASQDDWSGWSDWAFSRDTSTESDHRPLFSSDSSQHSILERPQEQAVKQAVEYAGTYAKRNISENLVLA